MRLLIPLLLCAALFNAIQEAQKTQNLFSLCAEWSAARDEGLSRFRGSLWQDGAGRFRLSCAQVYRSGEWEDLPVEIGLSESLRRPNFGPHVWISGRVQCRFPLRNPASIEDSLSLRLPPRVWLRAPVHFLPLARWSGLGLLRAVHERFRGWLNSLFQGYPGVGGFVRAVWTGDTRGLSPQLLTFYREGGLLPILALSGQHLAGLILCLSYLHWLFFAVLRKFLPGWAASLLSPYRRLLPSVCASVLWITSGGAAPMLRTLVMAVSVALLRSRGMHCTGIRILCSSCALMILWDVRQLMNISLALSVVATALTLIVFCEVRVVRRFLMYLVASVAIPVLMFPVTCFFFGRISWLAPLHQTLIGWFWDLVLIPMGFALPFVVNALPSSIDAMLLRTLESGWTRWLGLHVAWEGIVGNYYLVSVRPRWYEWILIECLLVGLLIRARRLFS